jgi:hypothetical protein
MSTKKAAGANADVEARIAQIEQMTLEDLVTFQCRMLTEFTTGKVTPRDARIIDRAVGKRLNAIENKLRQVG